MATWCLIPQECAGSRCCRLRKTNPMSLPTLQTTRTQMTGMRKATRFVLTSCPARAPQPRLRSKSRLVPRAVARAADLNPRATGVLADLWSVKSMRASWSYVAQPSSDITKKCAAGLRRILHLNQTVHSCTRSVLWLPGNTEASTSSIVILPYYHNACFFNSCPQAFLTLCFIHSRPSRLPLIWL